MMPPLARSVELESGLVITLGEPIPATVFVNRITHLFLYTGESDAAYIELHTRRP